MGYRGYTQCRLWYNGSNLFVIYGFLFLFQSLVQLVTPEHQTNTYIYIKLRMSTHESIQQGQTAGSRRQ